jgi:hypothetical protein
MLNRWVGFNDLRDFLPALIEHSEGYDLSDRDKMWPSIPKLSSSTLDHIRNIAQ